MPRGQSLIEIIVALGIFMIGMVAVASLLGAQFKGAQLAAETLQATAMAESGLAAARAARNRDWFALRAGTYGVSVDGLNVNLIPTPDTMGAFTRTVTVTEVDGATRDITSSVTWQSVAGRPRSVSLSTRLTDWWIVGRSGISGDWSDPELTEPSLNIDAGGTSVIVQNRIAYLTVASDAGEPDFYIIDVANADAPVVLGALEINSNNRGADDVAIYGNYAYLASRDDDFLMHIVDISDTSNPRLVSTFSHPEANNPGRTVAIDYPYVYLGTEEQDGNDAGEEEFWVIDVSDPANPNRVAAIEFDSDISDIALDGTYAFVAAGQDEFQELVVIDISTPSNPTAVGEFAARGSGAGYGVSLEPEEDRAAFVRWEGNPEFFILDISNRANPTEVGSARSPEHYHKVLAVENMVYASGTHNDAELVIYDITNPANPIELTSIDLRTNAEGMDFERNYLYVAVRSSSRPLAILTAD